MKPQDKQAYLEEYELLKKKGLVVVYPDFPRGKLASRALLDWVVKRSREAAPLVEWLAFATA